MFIVMIAALKDTWDGNLCKRKAQQFMIPLPRAFSDESLSLPGDNKEVISRRAYILFQDFTHE